MAFDIGGDPISLPGATVAVRDGLSTPTWQSAASEWLPFAPHGKRTPRDAMPHPSITHLSVPKIGVLQGTSAVAAWLHAKAGNYGPLERVNGRGWPKVSIAELERRAGRPYSAEAIAAAAAAPAQLRAKKQKASRAAKRAPGHLTEIIDAVAAARDKQWADWIASDEARAEFPNGPPGQAPSIPLPVLYSERQADHIAEQLVDEFVKKLAPPPQAPKVAPAVPPAPDAKPPRLYTAEQVCKAVTRATTDLENEWLAWRDRVLYPRKKYEPMRPLAKAPLPSEIDQLTKG